MIELPRVTILTGLLLASACSAAAQNSSLMRPPTSMLGHQTSTHAAPPPLPPEPAEPQPALARRYDPWAQAGPSPRYGQPPLAASDRYAGQTPNASGDHDLDADADAYRGPYAPGPYAPGPYASGPYASGPYASGPYASGPYHAPAPYDAPAQGYAPYQRVPRPVVSLDEASWTYQPAPPVRVYQRNDVITIRVDEITRMMAEGASFNRKRTLAELILTDWIRLKDFRLRRDPQEDGDPAVAAESNNNFRAQSMVESRESLTFNIAATVVDIRPNGNLVLEARKAIRVNDNLWETSLSGMCRAEDIAPDNVVLSKDVIDLEIRKEDRGHLRDAYSRGWLQRFVDRFGPF